MIAHKTRKNRYAQVISDNGVTVLYDAYEGNKCFSRNVARDCQDFYRDY